MRRNQQSKFLCQTYECATPLDFKFNIDESNDIEVVQPLKRNFDVPSSPRKSSNKNFMRENSGLVSPYSNVLKMSGNSKSGTRGQNTGTAQNANASMVGKIKEENAKRIFNPKTRKWEINPAFDPEKIKEEREMNRKIKTYTK